jgi:NMD protein affecting ribosome stability and mRNA decay
MAGYGAKEARISRERSTRVNLCTCGKEIDNTSLLCHDCYGEVHGQSKTDAEREVSSKI